MTVALGSREPVASLEHDPILGDLCARHEAADISEALVKACRSLSTAHRVEDPPVRLDTLLKAAGARREVRRLVGDGRLEVDSRGRFVVVVDDEQHWSRQRFTTAHELAHIVLFSEFEEDAEALRHLRSPGLWAVIERACNAAAAEVLMPASDVVSAVGRFGLDPEGLGGLQARYAVSWSALLVRLSEVLSIPVAVFRYHARHRSEAMHWRVHRFYGAGQGLWLPGGMTTRHLSAPVVEQAAASGLSEAKLTIDAPREAKVWALASSLVEAREYRGQEILFGRRPPEEVARWPEVAVFFGEGASPDPRRDVVDASGRGPEFSNLTLW